MDGPQLGMKSFEIRKRLVYEAWMKVQANDGAPGVDSVSIERFRRQREGQPLQAVEPDEFGELLPRAGAGGGDTEGPWGRGQGVGGAEHGGPHRPDRQQRCCWKRSLSRSSTTTVMAIVLGAVPMTPWPRPVDRCWKQDWVLDIDVRAFFDSVPHDLLLRAVAHHTDERSGPALHRTVAQSPHTDERRDPRSPRERDPAGCPRSAPLLANLFMHYAFNRWMDREYPGSPFERYADDVVIHCDTEAKAMHLWAKLAERLGSVRTRAAPRQDEGRVLQRRAPPQGLRAHQLRFPRLHLSGSPG